MLLLLLITKRKWQRMMKERLVWVV